MIVCFDIGGTSIKGAYARTPEDIELAPRIPTPTRDIEAFVASLKRIIDQSPDVPNCISISIAGIIHPQDGRAIVANIPCLHGCPIQERLQTGLGLPVNVANDADCFALAEAETGSGAGHAVVFGVILGTGVGGGLVVGGKLINSHGGAAGEWGHGPVAATQVGNPVVDLPRFRCGCGLEGCLDAVGSARGLEKLHRHLTGISAKAENILALWLDGDRQATSTVDIYVEVLSGPIAMILNTTGASIVPVGGGLSNVHPLISAIDVATRGKTLLRPADPIVIPGRHKIEPGIIGAAILGCRMVDQL